MIGTYADSVRRVLIGRVVATCGALVTTAGTFLPWIRSGERRRGSYQVFSLIERLGYSSSSGVGWTLRLWPLLPLLVVSTIALLWFHRSSAATAVGVIAAAYASTVSLAVRTASPSALTDIEYGPLVCLAGAIALLAGLLLVIWVPRPPHPQAP